MKALLLTENERNVCGIMLAVMIVFAGGVAAVSRVADETPYQLCPSRVAIMTTTGTDIHCN